MSRRTTYVTIGRSMVYFLSSDYLTWFTPPILYAAEFGLRSAGRAKTRRPLICDHASHGGGWFPSDIAKDVTFVFHLLTKAFEALATHHSWRMRSQSDEVGTLGQGPT